MSEVTRCTTVCCYRFGIDVLKRQLPLRLAVTAITPAVITSDKVWSGCTSTNLLSASPALSLPSNCRCRYCKQEQLVASIAFTDRQSLELFVKLGQHVLPEWLSIREGMNIAL